MDNLFYYWSVNRSGLVCSAGYLLSYGASTSLFQSMGLGKQHLSPCVG